MNKNSEMPSNKAVDETNALSKDFKAIALPGIRGALFLLFNAIPAVHLTLLLSVLVLVKLVWAKITVLILLLYVIPPIFARITLLCFPGMKKVVRTEEKEFLAWWLMLNLQGLFSRLPVFEELLRLIPGLYSAWLRLWGSKIGRLTYWAAGTRILDRSFLRIGDDVILGAGVRLNGHVFQKNKMGEMVLILDKIKVGNQAIIGGYSLLTAGTVISNGECTRAFTISPPFSKWENGKRIKLSKNDF